MSSFKIGAVVVLNSGGPLMTVAANRGDGTVTVNWFNKDQVKQVAVFHPQELRAATSGDAPAGLGD